jgi:hypothetical protein
MAQRARRQRGTGIHNIAFFAEIPPATKAKLKAAADALELSYGQVLEILVDLVEVDEHGRPVHWPDPDQEELPLNRSA